MAVSEATKGVANGGTRTNGINGTSEGGPPDATTHAGNKAHLREVETSLNDAPAYKARKLRVVTIGAGYSGLTLAHKFQHQHPELQGIIDHTIYESRKELGGTWLVNTYPGVVCDVPSHIYVSILRKTTVWLLTDISRLFHSTLILSGVDFSRPGARSGLI